MKKFKMPSAFTILFIIIIIVAVLTWIIPAGAYDYAGESSGTPEPIPGTYREIEKNTQGIWEILQAPISGFFDAVDIILFILVIGGFLAVVADTGAIDAGIGSIVRKFSGRETLMIPILMLLFGLGGTIFGMSEETIAFYVLIIPIFIAAGFDTVTGAAVVFIGAGIGCLGSTVNPFATGIASGFAGISIGEGIVLRLAILVLTMAISIVFVMRYAKRVKANPELSIVADMRADNEAHFLAHGEDGSYENGDIEKETAAGAVASSNAESNKMSGRQKAILAVFGICFFIMILGVIPWADKFGIYIFEDISAFLADIPVLGTVLGKIVPLGEWWFSDITVLFLFGSLVCAFIWRWNETKFTELFVDGARDLLGVALIIGVTRGITVVMNDGGMTATILHLGEESLKSLGASAFIGLSYLFFILLSFLVPSSSGLAALSMPIMAPIADFVGVGRDLVVTAYATASGIVNLITPTSGVLMGALAIARIPYGTFLKWILKLVAVLFVLILAVLCVAAAIS
ncbi:MAG: YfcC family protein [Firmicutes bacterium]|nr:YfcC family protein [Bacillota bacterium]